MQTIGPQYALASMLPPVEADQNQKTEHGRSFKALEVMLAMSKSVRARSDRSWVNRDSNKSEFKT